MAMIKYSLEYGDSSFRPVIDHFMTFIMEKEHRLQDGTFARNRLQKNTFWLDDLFMSVPAISYKVQASNASTTRVVGTEVHFAIREERRILC